MIIIKFPDFIQNNLEKNKNIFKQQIYGCSSCVFEGRLYSHGSYMRNLITEESTFPITIYRVKCPVCGKTHALIPDFIIPYFQHSFYVIKKCLEFKYLKGSSYSTIANYFQTRSIDSYIVITETAISSFIKRFTCSIPKIKSFFNAFTEIYSNESTTAKELLHFINEYESISNNSFNVHFFENMPTYFMCKT
jgi:hypothetical protein